MTDSLFAIAILLISITYTRVFSVPYYPKSHHFLCFEILHKHLVSIVEASHTAEHWHPYYMKGVYPSRVITRSSLPVVGTVYGFCAGRVRVSALRPATRFTRANLYAQVGSPMSTFEGEASNRPNLNRTDKRWDGIRVFWVGECRLRGQVSEWHMQKDCVMIVYMYIRCLVQFRVVSQTSTRWMVGK